MSKKIGIVGIRGLPANYGAFDTFVDQFVKDENIVNSNIFFSSVLSIKIIGNLDLPM